MEEDERIPIKYNDSTKHVNAYLVEAQTLEGLSGAPVFVDRTTRVKLSSGEIIKASAWTSLLGIWQAAWDAPPTEILGAGRPSGTRVPVGMGLVVPAYRIIEVLEKQELKDMRNKIYDEIELQGAAVSDSAPPTTDDNRHK